MKVLVLGGTGFIGSHIVDELIKHGHDVRVLSHHPEVFRQPVKDVDYHYADISDKSSLKKALNGIDSVVHAASSTVPSSSNRDPISDIQNNLIGLINLLDEMLAQNVQRILFLSSGGTIYGRAEHNPVAEDHSLRPKCSYAAVKIAMEHYLGIFQSLHNINPVIIRPANPYGPRQSLSGEQGVIASFSLRALKGEPLLIWGPGKEIRDFFHVQDLARLCVLALESSSNGTFNAGSGMGHSIIEVASLICHALNTKAEIRQTEPQSFGIPEIVLDISKAKQHFGWEPQIPFQKGLSEYCMWIKNTVLEQGRA